MAKYHFPLSEQSEQQLYQLSHSPLEIPSSKTYELFMIIYLWKAYSQCHWEEQFSLRISPQSVDINPRKICLNIKGEIKKK